jgi:hypothetical protein
VKVYRSTTPAAFRLGEVEVHPDRDHFAISECRLPPGIKPVETAFREAARKMCAQIKGSDR